MKISKRLLAVLMSVVMVLTIVPLGLFAFAGEDPEQDGSAKHPWIITSLEQFNEIGKEESKYLLTDNYVLGNDIIPQTVEDKVFAWLDASGDNQTSAGEAVAPLYAISNAESAETATDYYEKNTSGEYDKVEFTEGKQYEVDKYYIFSSDEYVISSDPYDETITYYEDDGNGGYQEVEFIPAKLYEAGKYYTLVLAEGDPLTCELFENMPDDAFAVAYPIVKNLSGVSDDDNDPNEIQMVAGNFKGTFDGAGHTIDQVVLTQNGGIYGGLFENNKGTIINLNLGSKFYIEFTPDISKLNGWNILLGLGIYAGGIAAINAEKATISGCKFDGSISIYFADTLKAAASSTEDSLSTLFALPMQVGGITGVNTGDIKDSTATSVLISSDYVGGTSITAGKIKGTDNDITLSSDAKKVANFDDELPSNVTVEKTEQVEEKDKYQLLLVKVDEENFYYYIRMISCEHLNIKDENHVLAVTPTCKTAGNIEYWTCPDCNQKFAGPEKPTIDSTSVLTVGLSKNRTNHDATTVKHTDAADPTCGADGNIEYWYCSTCNAYMIAATGAEDETVVTIEGVEGNFIEVDQSKTVVKATGEHNTATHYAATEPTYTTKGNKEYWQCDECGLYFLEATCETSVDYDKDIAIAEVPAPTVVPKTTSKYTVSTTDNVLSNVKTTDRDGITVADFLANLDAPETGTYVVRDKNGEVKTDGILCTGDTIEVSVEVETGVFQSFSKLDIAVMGDVNGDGLIRAADAKMVLDEAARKPKTFTGVYALAANVDGRTDIKASDAKIILDYSAKVITTF